MLPQLLAVGEVADVCGFSRGDRVQLELDDLFARLEDGGTCVVNRVSTILYFVALLSLTFNSEGNTIREGNAVKHA